MGVPKFYRWISERYPCLSEVVKEFQLPEFDNLYLDMNGIIHVCSHPDDENPHFRITEEKIFKDICHYIDFLFRMIKPRKVFFMAVDGVAPRAKMNQQRGRRFRSAKEAELLIQKAQEKGEVLPTEKRFDSNCITPGTPFMVRLQEHLKYFVVDKISHDPLWQGPKIYLSGHETPGEGEHKVMDFIRYSKSQGNHDPDTRHCLYGLDADLIMLGLTSHEPHFSLLREEVRFGGRKDKNKRPVTPEETTFHLLHLSLMRDYLAYEFSDLKDKLSFPWDLEKIIDDWILMGFLVGNDFIPHLPHLHIHQDALPLLWKTYMKVLPQLDGYINEAGRLNLPRFEKYMMELSKYDEDTFESAFSDLSYLESKLGGKTINESVGASRQKAKMKKLKPFKVKKDGNPFLALEDESTNNDIIADIIDSSDNSDDDDDDDEFDYDEYDDDDDDDEEEDYNTIGDEFKLHKRNYYMDKMSYSEVTHDVLKDQAHGYVIAIQWILLYYFEGCPSWSWFYPHHYAPYISDVRNFSDMVITFDLSTPFLPFQQLMAVLPAASKDLLPPALQPLMTEPSSPIIDFYPVNFETDLNGKQQDWEAVVLIPFIEERRLLEAMASKDHLLTKEEKDRNQHGPHMLYQYTQENQGLYKSSLPGVFPDIHYNRAKISKLDKNLFNIDANCLRKGLLDTVRLHVYFPGFPKLRFIPHTHELAKCGCKVFQHNSRGENMLLRIQFQEGVRLEEVADELLGNVTYVGWPHLHEARVVAVANESFKIELLEENGTKGSSQAVSYNRKKLRDDEAGVVAKEAMAIKERHKDRFAIDVGNTEIVIYASPMTGKMYTFNSNGTVTLKKQFASAAVPYLHQMSIKDLDVEDSPDEVLKTLEEVFPKGCDIFMTGNPHYGAQGKVLEILGDQNRIRIAIDVKEEPDFRHMSSSSMHERYFNNYQAAQQIGIDGHIMARITGSIFIEKSGVNGGKANIGLNLKFTKKGEEVPGYTKKLDDGWGYSFKCIKTVEDYINSFPDLWLTVQQNKSNNDVFSEALLFPEHGKSKLKDVLKYLEELPCTKAPRMKFGSEILDEDRVKEIETMVDGLNKVPDTVKMKVKARLLFRPLANQGTLVPDPDADFYLYDRIVVVKAGYSVPFGKRGTIIGIPEAGEGITPHSLYDVVFDEAFTGGITLRCSENKGYRVPGSAMLNLTFGEFRKNVGMDKKSSRNSARMHQSHSHDRSSASSHHSSPGSHHPSYNNNNNLAGQRVYNDRNGAYPDRAAIWRQQQQQQFSKPGQGQHFQQQGVKWDNGQPLFGQYFVGQNQFQGKGQSVTPPKFVTPKMQGPQALMAKNANGEASEHSEFENLWKSLYQHVGISSTATSEHTPKQATSAFSPQLLQKSSNLAQSAPKPLDLIQSLSNPKIVPSKPSALLATPASSGTGTEQTRSGPVAQKAATKVENLAKAKVASEVSGGCENAEFLAMFNSLKTQAAEAKLGGSMTRVVTAAQQTPPVTAPLISPKSQADLALKQLLKIGVSASEAQPASTPSFPQERQHSPMNHLEDASVVGASLSTGVPAPVKSPVGGSVYGRQLSVQELFAEANRHQQKTHNSHEAQQTAPQSGMDKVPENRDPISELEAYCSQHLTSGAPQFDFKNQPKQNSYIANVILPNGHRYEGSMCKTKAEAAKSAASIALLCLNTKPNTSHPVLTGYMPAQRPNVNRFFSHNSAFSPIVGPLPNLLPSQHSQILLPPQHFVNQPPPPIPLLQLLQQQYQSAGHHTQSYPTEQQRHMHQRGAQATSPHGFHNQPNQGNLASHTGQSGNHGNVSGSSTTHGSSTVTQQFIPLQVARNQTHASKRRESESEPDTKPVKPVDNPALPTASSTAGEHPLETKPHTKPSGVVTPEQKDIPDKNGVLSQVYSPTTHTVKSLDKKKKSRLAANFQKK
ncbi:5'-3' exoribonuclease 1-like isoform X2 [Physella acuta]|uniref:5'-3' exoribonuclease 1-like isoform X2 n=1 Tax=Physella acuta TaxID=109671 RepID=UPI0027DD3753|nr:5'-3' exoribonuclease 1-like isoform X2 [Physella acuta]